MSKEEIKVEDAFTFWLDAVERQKKKYAKDHDPVRLETIEIFIEEARLDDVYLV